MKQITVIARNYPGLMADVSGELAKAGINIESLDAESFNDSAVIIMTVDRYDFALRVLQGIHGITAVSEDAIVIRLRNEAGALAQISKRFKDANINIRSMRFLSHDDDYAIVAISTERTRDAIGLVKDVMVG